MHELSLEARQQKRRAQWIYYTVWIAMSGVITTVGLLALRLGYRLPDWYSVLGMVSMPLWDIPARAACRLAGVSRRGRAFEVIQRDPGAAVTHSASGAPEFDSKDLWILKARVDRGAIEAKHTDGQWTRVEWRDIETCIFKAMRDDKGDYSCPRITLQGSDGLALLQFPLGGADPIKLLCAIRFYLRGESPEPKPEPSCR